MAASQLLTVADPEGDTIIILRNPKFSLEDWNHNTYFKSHRGILAPPKTPLAVFDELPLRLPIPCEPQARTAHEDSDCDEIQSIRSKTISRFSSTVSVYGDEGSEHHYPPLTAEYHFKVSSRQLKIVSPLFKGLFENEKKGIRWDPLDRKYRLKAYGLNPDALAILLHVVHMRTELVSGRYDLDMLVKLASVVDYFKMQGAVRIHSASWISTLDQTQPAPTHYGHGTVLWMYVSWVFRHETIFKKTTATFIKHGRCSFQASEFHVQKVITKLNEERCNSITKLVDSLHNILYDLRAGHGLCTFECGAMLLGTLMKHMEAAKLLSDLTDRPRPPFNGISYDEIADTVKRMNTPQWRVTNQGHNGVLHASKHCRLQDLVNPILDNLDQELGLSLEDFDS